jgi:hypothetical protein
MVRKQVEEADTDLLREMVKLFFERVMGEEPTRSAARPTVSDPMIGPTVATATGTGHGTPAPARSTWPCRSSGRAVISPIGSGAAATRSEMPSEGQAMNCEGS